MRFSAIHNLVRSLSKSEFFLVIHPNIAFCKVAIGT